MSHELTRRDALAALSAAGVAVAGCLAAPQSEESEERPPESPLDEDTRRTFVAAAEVLYPDDVTGIDEFVTAYADRRAADRPEHAAGITEAVAYLDEYCRAWYDDEFAALSPGARDEALRRMGADEADPVPDGGDVERVRYYLINDLLLALYASPTGGRLVGIENPPGHPGGLASYQRGGQP